MVAHRNDVSSKMHRMELVEAKRDAVVVELSTGEVGVLQNALHEILNGPEAIEEWEFQTRVGVSREEANVLPDAVVRLPRPRVAQRSGLPRQERRDTPRVVMKPRYNRDENPQLYELTVMLWAAWDPIGAGTGVPTDEYAAYAAQILALLQTCSSDESRGSSDAFQALVAELSTIRTERIGLEPEPDADHLAAWKLRDWYEWQAGLDHRGLSR